MKIPVYVTKEGIETYVKPWVRPELVYWEPSELPPWAKQEPAEFNTYCCCYGGFSGYYGNVSQPVPEIGTGFMMAVGVIMVVLVKKWKAK